MNATTVNPEVRAYLDAVRAHLADVPQRELDELADDLEGHLLEVAAEDDGTLEERLGPPEVYADELRATAGLPSRDAAERERLSRRAIEWFERSAVGHMIDVAAKSTTVHAVRTLVPELRPGWWVLRGYLVVWAAGILLYEGYYTNPFVPNLGSYAVGIATAVGAIVVSVALGRSTKTQPLARRFSWLVNAGMLAAGIAAVSNAGNVFQIQYVSESSGPEYLSHAGGATISNICPYSSNGTLLSGILLFDQDGRPIDDAAPVYSVEGYPIDPLQPQIANAYPRDFTGIERGRFYPYGPETALTCPPTLTGAPAEPGG